MTTSQSSPVLESSPWSGRIFNGEWVAAKGGSIDIKEPASGKLLGRAGLADATDVSTAARAAAQAQPAWAATPVRERCEVLFRAAAYLQRHSEELAAFIARETGGTFLKAMHEVREAQALLAEQGYYESEIDGRPGQATDLAIRAFQRAQGLKIDGMATPLLLTQLRNAANPLPPLADDPIAQLAAGVDPGATGAVSASGDPDLVRQIQAKLAEARVADLKADGILGERTRAAIRTFQALESLEVTGEPSPEVLSRLNSL